MKFSEAMKALEEGKKVNFSEWPKNIYWEKENLSESLFWPDCAYRIDRLMSKDWELYDDSPKLSFSEVVKGLKEGKRFKRKSWHSFIFVHQEMGLLRNQEGYTFQWDLEDFEADDWEQVK